MRKSSEQRCAWQKLARQRYYEADFEIEKEILVTNMKRAILLRPGKRLLLSFAAQVLLLWAIMPLSFAAEDTPVDANHFSTDTAALYQTASKIAPPAGADVVVLENEERVSFNTDGKAVCTRYFLYKVLTQKGANDWASIAASWEPWREERPSLRARVITSDGVAHPLDPSTITDAPGKETENDVFSDRRILRAPLPAVAPGVLVEEEQVSKQSAPFFGGASVERFYFGGSTSIQQTRLLLDAPGRNTNPLRHPLASGPQAPAHRDGWSCAHHL